MALIPTARDVTKVAPQSAGVVQVNPKAFGAGLGDGIEKAANSLIEFAGKAYDEERKTEAQNLSNKLSAYSRTLMLGDGTDTNPGYANLAGQDAIDKRKEAEENFTRYRDELLTSASSDRVRKYAQSTFDRQTETTLGNIATRAASAKKTLDEGVWSATIAEAHENAAANAGDDAAVLQSIGDVKNAAKKFAELKYGAGALDAAGQPLADKEAAQAASKAHVAVVTALLRQPNGSEKADKYYTNNLQEIAGTARTELRRRIDEHTDLEVAQSAADKIEAKFGGLRTGADLRAAYAEAQSSFSGQREKAVVAELDRRVAIAARVQKLDEDAAAARVSRYFEQGGGQRTLATLAKDDPDAHAIISRDARLLEHYRTFSTRMVIEGENALYARVSDGATVGQLMNDPNFANIDLVAHRSKLTKDQFSQLEKAQTAEKVRVEDIKNGEGQIYQRADGIATKAAEHIKNKTKKADALVSARTAMTAFVQDFAKQHNRQPTDVEMRKEALRLWVSIEADPANTGALGWAKEGEDSVSMFVSQASKMSPQQRAVARVPIADIKPEQKKAFLDSVRARTGKPDLVLTDSQYEELAGAAALEDTERTAKILEALKK